MTAPFSELARAAELTRLTAERDAALAEVQRLREALAFMVSMKPQYSMKAYELATGDASYARHLEWRKAQFDTARALVSPP